MSKKAQLLAYLKAGHIVTKRISMRLWGLDALSQRITELKHEGNDIRTTLVEINKHTRVGSYWMPMKVRHGKR